MKLENIRNFTIARMDWYLKIGSDKACTDIVASLTAMRIILEQLTGNDRKYCEILDEMLKASDELCHKYLSEDTNE